MVKQLLVLSLLVTGFGLAFAKLPAPDEATKAKAAETAAKAAWQAKVDAYQLCRAQDRAVAAFRKSAGDRPAASTASAPATAATGAPVAYSPPPPCTDPGPFTYNPPEQKPLEAAAAHSPSGTAASPPSTAAESAQAASAQKK